MPYNLSGLELSIVLIPAFILVWAFRYFAGVAKTGEFEYIGLSIVWGIINMGIVGAVFSSAINNGAFGQISVPITMVIPFSFFAFVFGFVGALISKARWFKKMIKFLKDPYKSV